MTMDFYRNKHFLRINSEKLMEISIISNVSMEKSSQIKVPIPFLNNIFNHPLKKDFTFSVNLNKEIDENNIPKCTCET